MRFWDSAAVVPLLVARPESPRVDGWIAEDPQAVIWTLTIVEVLSAVRRLQREGRIREAAADEAERRAEDLVAASHVVVDVEGVKAQVPL